MVGFVDDHEVPIRGRDLVSLTIKPPKLHAGDDIRLLADVPWVGVWVPLAEVAKHCSVMVEEDLIELRAQLLLPLRDEAGWRKDENAIEHASRAKLLEDKPGLNRLTKTHLVGEDQTRPRFGERAHCNRDLVVLRLNPRVRERGGRIVPVSVQQSECLTSEPAVVWTHNVRRCDEQLEWIVVDREKVGRRNLPDATRKGNLVFENAMGRGIDDRADLSANSLSDPLPYLQPHNGPRLG